VPTKQFKLPASKSYAKKDLNSCPKVPKHIPKDPSAYQGAKTLSKKREMRFKSHDAAACSKVNPFSDSQTIPLRVTPQKPSFAESENFSNIEEHFEEETISVDPSQATQQQRPPSLSQMIKARFFQKSPEAFQKILHTNSSVSGGSFSSVKSSFLMKTQRGNNVAKSSF